FPLIRSVGLKAATASSRVATLPMFVRTRPSRARRTISLSWARSGTTTKSTVRPSAGRASVGPVMVTSVPPARIRPADRFAMSPPRTSKTRSTPPTSSSASLSMSTNSCAPRSRAACQHADAPPAATETPADPADIFQGVLIEVDELLRAEVERRLTAGSAPGADHVGAGLTCKLGHHRTDYARRTVHEA